MSKMLVPLKYKLIKDGVLRSDGVCIPASPKNRDWKQYQEWLADGNTPDPIETPEEQAAREQAEEVSELKRSLARQQVWMFRMIIEMWKAMKFHTDARSSDIDPDVMAKATSWVAKLERLKEIDE